MATAERERPDVSLQDAYHTAWLVRLQQAEPMLGVVPPEGGAMTRGLIIAADEGPVRTLADLAGRRVAISSRRSYSGYIAQTSLLERTVNLHAGSMNFISVRWSDRVEACMRQGRADAGFIGEADLWPGARVLARTEPIPTACVVRFPHTPDAVAAVIRQTLAELGARSPEDAAVLKGLGIRGFARDRRAGPGGDRPARRELARLLLRRGEGGSHGRRGKDPGDRGRSRLPGGDRRDSRFGRIPCRHRVLGRGRAPPRHGGAPGPDHPRRHDGADDQRIRGREEAQEPLPGLPVRRVRPGADPDLDRDPPIDDLPIPAG